MTKLDGDARGGAALSVRAVTGMPIMFASVGEKLDQLEEFHPDRMASRILGMGDVADADRAGRGERSSDDEAARARARSSQTLGVRRWTTCSTSSGTIRKMGSLGSLLKMIPGIGKQVRDMHGR